LSHRQAVSVLLGTSNQSSGGDMLKRKTAVLGAIAVLIVASRPAWSQESQGTILGRITDSSDLVIPNAVVQVTNIATSVTLKTNSNAVGNYYAPFLIPGTYRITVEKSGFKTFVRDGIVLNVNDRLEIN